MEPCRLCLLPHHGGTGHYRGTIVRSPFRPGVFQGFDEVIKAGLRLLPRRARHGVEGELPVPGGRMYWLKCETTVIKLLKLNRTPTAKPAADGIAGGLGDRFFTIYVAGIQSLMAQLETNGIRATVPIREARPGVTIAIVTDPDGNTVEFSQNT